MGSFYMGNEREGRFEPGAADRPLNELVDKILQDLQTMFRAEARLATSEIKESVRQGAKAGMLLGAAAVAGFLAGACFITTCIVALAIVLPLWLAALLMGVMLATGAGGAFLLGRMALERVDVVPQRTLETVKDNIDWAKNRSV